MTESELWDKKEPYTPEEFAFLKKALQKNRKNYVCKYAFYRKQSSKGMQVAFIIDSMNYCPRRSAVENYWEIICTRPISDIEWDEEIQNYGRHLRRFQVWYYESVYQLQIDDSQYNIETPQLFVKECHKRGYNQGCQTIINFNN